MCSGHESKRRVQTEIVKKLNHSLSEEIPNPVGVWTLSSMSFPGKSILMAVHMSQMEGCAYHIVHSVMVDVSGFYRTVLDSSVRGSTRELAGPNSLQTCCVSGIRLLQSPSGPVCVCVFPIDSGPYRFVGVFVEVVIYCIKVVSLTSVSDIMDSLPLTMHAALQIKTVSFMSARPFKGCARFKNLS